MAPIANTSDNPDPPYDYTEGASAIDIGNAVANARRSRRNSEYSTYYNAEGEGSMFSGPGHSVNPSSVSRMSRIDLGRRSSDMLSSSRRKSRDSGRVSRRSTSQNSLQDGNQSILNGDAQSLAPEDDANALFNDEDGLSTASVKKRRRRKSNSPTRAGVFGNIANLFSRNEPGSPPTHRRSLSQGSTSRFSRRSRRSVASENAAASDDEEERWGYSSGEEDSEDEARPMDNASIASSMKYDSDHQSMEEGPHLPMLDFDPVFGGESRIDMEMSFTLTEPPPEGPPSRQTIYIADEDSTIRFVGYEPVPRRLWCWRIACVLSAGLLALFGHWFPKLWLRWVAREKAFINSKKGFIVVESSYKAIMLLPIRVLSYPFLLSTVFPSNLAIAPGLTVLEPSIKDYDGTTGYLKQLLIVDYRYTRFAVDPRTGLFSLVRDWRDPVAVTVLSVLPGITNATHDQREILFGKNEIDIEAKPTLTLLVDEVIHPFYVFQIASIILWCLDNYYYYAFCIGLISFASITSTLIDTKRTIARMREMSRLSCNVDVLRNGEWAEKASSDLVLGDIVNLSTSQITTIPADMFLLSGDAIVNESMLTGESVPVSKTTAKDDDLARWNEDKAEIAKCFLYGGTRVVRIRGAMTTDGKGRPALAMVARSGFDTTKGALVRSMLFPKPIGFKFYRDSVRFIGVLAGLAAFGFCFSAIQFVRMGIPWRTIVIRALDLITVVVPPALPATLSIGTSFAISRLRSAGIYCISPSRVNVAGKINVCCFDKTGTLTEDGLDILGIRPLDRNANQFSELMEDIHDLPMGNQKATFLHALATCHSLKMVGGELVGDPLDVKMFEFTHWALEESRAGIGNIKAKGAVVEQAQLVQVVVRPPGGAAFRLEDALKGAAKRAYFLELGVIRTFEFVSSLRRMSVIVKRLKGSSMEIYVKGAPEVMTDICDPDSLPQDYDDLLAYYTKRGYRVIAIAGKSIEGLSWLKAQKMKREQAESGLRFLGLIIFENRLKPGTAPAIQALRNAHLACRMITGDNPMTAVSVARECNLISQAAHVFFPTFLRGNSTTPLSKLQWTCMDDPLWELDDYSLKPLQPPRHHTVDEDEIAYQDYSLVITGDVFRWMLSYAALETLQRMLVKTQIFARMSPDEKNEVVERLQALGYNVLMCGDGANDCAALKAADVGISLSEAEASVAAPFTSSTPDVGCVLEVIKEGRAALVTSFSCFKYMALYSLIQFTSVSLLYYFASSLGDFQFLYIDLFIIIPVAVTMARTLPYPRIYPKRPTANLVSRKVLTSIIGQVAITTGVQVWAYLWVRRQSWYTPPPGFTAGDGDKLESTNYENTAVFLISCFQYILVAAVFSIGPPYRKPMWTNGWLMFSMLSLLLINTWLLLSPSQVVVKLLTLMELPQSARYYLLIAAGVNIVLSLAFERWGTVLTSELLARIAYVWNLGGKWKLQEGKAYKAVENGFQ